MNWLIIAFILIAICIIGGHTCYQFFLRDLNKRGLPAASEKDWGMGVMQNLILHFKDARHHNHPLGKLFWAQIVFIGIGQVALFIFLFLHFIPLLLNQK